MSNNPYTICAFIGSDHKNVVINASAATVQGYTRVPVQDCPDSVIEALADDCFLYGGEVETEPFLGPLVILALRDLQKHLHEADGLLTKIDALLDPPVDPIAPVKKMMADLFGVTPRSEAV